MKKTTKGGIKKSPPQKAKKKKASGKRKVNRNSISGKFASDKFTEAHPDITETETVDD
jgi:hypothetical protein